MVIFWIVDMGLVANLAVWWSGAGCSYDYYWGYYSCSYRKRGLDAVSSMKRDTTTIEGYYGALAAGAFFGSVEL